MRIWVFVELQAPDHLKKHLSFAFLRMSSQSSAVLNELANSIESMTKPGNLDVLIKDMGMALAELQLAIKYVPRNTVPVYQHQKMKERQLTCNRHWLVYSWLKSCL